MTIQQVSEKYGLSQDAIRYYEKVGAIPRVTRTKSGQRDFGEEDIRWLELARCLRSAGVSVEAVAEYVQLFSEGDETIPDRLELLRKEYRNLEEQKKQVESAMERLENKIRHYETAVETGVLDWSK